jgi:peptide/nickel transport system ATP-binding protein/oligopeptide transport system ATP-binding protein
VDGVSLDVMSGETFGIIGESGLGKTTLGRALVCLEKPSAGQVLHRGSDSYKLSRRQLQQHRREYHVVLQDPMRRWTHA